MKKQLLSLLLLLSCVLSAQQKEWAPIGAKWYYTEQFAFSGSISYILFESVADTVILGKNCRILQKSGDIICSEREMRSKEYMYQSGDTIFCYDPIINDFYILYNFGAQAGDSWSFTISQMSAGTGRDTIVITVDSSDIVTINGQNLKRIFCSALFQYSPPYSFGGTQFQAIETIGSLHFMFYAENDINGHCDANWTSGLRCYEDSTLGLYHSYEKDCDYTYTWTPSGGVSVENVDNQYNVKIYPQPASHSFYVELPQGEGFIYELYHLSGQLLQSGSYQGISPMQINCQSIPAGLYLLRLTERQGGKQWQEKLMIGG